MRSLRSCLLILTLHVGCGSEDAPSDRYEINGSVHDARSNAPVEKASVTFVSDALDQADTATDHDGRFSLQVAVREGVAYGTVRATRDGYEPSAARSVYFDGLPIVLDLELVPVASKPKAK